MTKTKKKHIIDKISEEYGFNDERDYIDLYEDSSCLDGWFTSTQLRRIAEAMDDCKAVIEKGGF